jgi:hypothetical protein
MNNIHNNGNNEKDLERLGQAYTRLQREEPPELLDQAVLNSARRAVESKPHWMKFSWVHGLTTAAVFVLAFSLVLNQREPAPDYEGDLRSGEPDQLQTEVLMKKQAADEPADSLRLQEREKGEAGRDDAQRSRGAMPAVPAPEPSISPAEEPESAAVVKSSYSSELRASKALQADADAGEVLQKTEERAEDMADSLADHREAGLDDITSSPVVAEAVGSARREAQTEAEQSLEIEKRIQAIIELKQSGDPEWQTELASFRENYPDYPLPDELKH